MFCIGICDDDEGLCGELEKMLYDYGKENKLQMNIDIWYQGESLCRFLRENKKILDVLFLDIELLTTNGIEVGRFIREEQEKYKKHARLYQTMGVMSGIFLVVIFI